MLTATDHRRDRLGLNYIYPVISRRSNGLSIGINLNTNNTCNWRCIYCQVPGLRRGKAPDIDLQLLEHELKSVLTDILHGDFCSRYQLPAASGSIRDIAFSGNGEPTNSKVFAQVVELIGRMAGEFGLLNQIRIVLITNGSQIYRPAVRNGIECLSQMNGEVWFKFDSAISAGLRSINNASIPVARVRRNLEMAAKLCPTWIQTCVFALDDKPPTIAAQEVYLQFISSLMESKIPLKGILLYGIARPSQQPEATRLTRLPAEWLEQYATRLRSTGIEVKVNA
jgi:wyosine [tRNA(Phe)-imidazoG37] synthetase (radical SAM superfamily)